jgi:hypothetical protein
MWLGTWNNRFVVDLVFQVVIEIHAWLSWWTASGYERSDERIIWRGVCMIPGLWWMGHMHRRHWLVFVYRYKRILAVAPTTCPPWNPVLRNGTKVKSRSESEFILSIWTSPQLVFSSQSTFYLIGPSTGNTSRSFVHKEWTEYRTCSFSSCLACSVHHFIRSCYHLSCTQHSLCRTAWASAERSAPEKVLS